MSETATACGPAGSPALPRESLGLAILGLLLVTMAATALVTYKASGALATIAKVEVAGTLAPKTERFPTAGVHGVAKPVMATANYFSWVLVALGFGVLMGAMVKTLIPDAWLVRTVAARGLRGQILSAAVGAPLMLCSCCVAPIFEGVYERTRRLGPALGLMLASPALNPAALLLTFMLFPADLAWARLGLSLVLVLLAAGGLGRAFVDSRAVECSVDWQQPGARGLGRGFLVSLGQVMVRSVPAIVLGVVASAAIAGLLPIGDLAKGAGAFGALLLVAALAVPLALPTFGEIPIGLALLAAGTPKGAVLALLLAGPSINLPSLLTIAKVVSVRAALATAATVFALAVLGGAITGL